MADVTQNGFHVLGSFDCFQPHFPGHALWLLQRDNANELSLDVDSAPIHASAVGADGFLFPKYCKQFTPNTDDTPAFWLVAYLFDPAHATEFQLKGSEGNQVGTVKVSDILKDNLIADLERRWGASWPSHLQK
jgi:hypothetical protein